MKSENRRLAAILFADIQGYTALMQSNEQLALSSLQKFKTQLETQVPQHNGQIINFYGDGCLAIFNSSVDATACAKYLQQVFQQEPKVPVRIGLNVGDIILRDDNVYGDAVNIASRIESLGVPGSVLLSTEVKNQIKNQEAFDVSLIGEFEFKNVEGIIGVYALTNDGLVIPNKEALKGKLKLEAPKKNWTTAIVLTALAVLAFFAYQYFSAGTKTIPLSGNNNTITIFPFEIKGSTDLQYLGEGMVDLISTKLDDIPEISAIDPNVLFNQLKIQNNLQPELSDAIELSRSFGATRFVIGNMVVLNDLIEVTASKYDVDGQLISNKNITGRTDDLASMVDELIRILIADELDLEGQEQASTAAMTSQSLPALKAYLLGEQAFRKMKIGEAVDHYDNAVKADSSFALAWVRLRDAGAWSPNFFHPEADQKAATYKDRLPKKWKIYVSLVTKNFPNILDRINAFKKLEQQYGETSEFTEQIADDYFHHMPAYGKSILETKAYLQKAVSLNPNNQEATIHLMEIAAAENDNSVMNKILEEADSTSDFWAYHKLKVLSLQKEITEAEILEVINHPKFQRYYLSLFMAAPEDVLAYSDKMLKFIPYVDSPLLEAWLQRENNGLKGKEKAAYNWSKKLLALSTEDPAAEFFFKAHSLTLPAFLWANSGYTPFAEEYSNLFESLQNNKAPAALYASWKYATQLEKKEDGQRLKTALKNLSESKEDGNSQGKFYYYSLLAFEARSEKDNATALRWIDSTYQYSPGGWTTHSAYLDKMFMLADIYEEQGEYDKAIPYLENYPIVQNFPFTKGYATYRLTQLYEKNDQYDKAFAKCNLFLKDYADCDEKYRPWVEEVKERRERLVAKEL